MFVPKPSDFAQAEPAAGRLDSQARDALERLLRGFFPHSPPAAFDVGRAPIVETPQDVEADPTSTEIRRAAGASPYTVSHDGLDGAGRAPLTTRSTPARKAVTRPRGRPPRRMQGPLTHTDMRDLNDARAFAAEIDKPLNCPVDLNPWFLDAPPEGDVGGWLRDGPLRIMAQWAKRQGIGWFAVTVRENYAGPQREHAHALVHCPACLRPKLAAMLESAFPGAGAVHVHLGGETDEAQWAYRTKQRTARAAGPPGPRRPTPETKSRVDGSPVAPVLGRRISISRSLAKPERIRAGWQVQRDEQRAVARVKAAARRARERGDAGLSPMGTPSMV